MRTNRKPKGSAAVFGPNPHRTCLRGCGGRDLKKQAKKAGYKSDLDSQASSPKSLRVRISSRGA